MATTFPATTYPLAGRTEQQDISNTVVDYLDDGTPKLRQLSATDRAKISVVFLPLNEANANTLRAYLLTNRTTEFDLTVKSSTYRGYFVSDAKISDVMGDLYVITVEFDGVLQ